jgi:hypothetical protein
LRISAQTVEVTGFVRAGLLKSGKGLERCEMPGGVRGSQERLVARAVLGSPALQIGKGGIELVKAERSVPSLRACRCDRLGNSCELAASVSETGSGVRSGKAGELGDPGRSSPR